jgi:predicted outer membrane repeat protein
MLTFDRYGRVAVIVVASAATVAHARTTWYVDDDNCPGPGSGTPGDPFCSIQAAIDASADLDEIVVAPGTYVETIHLWTKAITLRSSDGAAATVLDAQGAGPAVTGTRNAVLEGLTISNGSADHGGGLAALSGDPVVIGCVFLHNSSPDDGGAVFSDAANVTLVDCAFIGNAASIGGAIHLEGGEAEIRGCAFIGNSCDSSGGAIRATHADVRIEDCVRSGNEAGFGGAVNGVAGVVRLRRCRFYGNLAVTGGAVAEHDNLEFEMVNCDASFNSGGQGGGLHLGSAVSNVVNCTIAGNTGAGVWVTAGFSNVVLANCVIWGNSQGSVDGPGTVSIAYSDVEGGWSGPGAGNIDADPQLVPDLSGTWTSDPVYDAATDLTVLTDANADYAPGALVGRQIVPDTTVEPAQTVVLANTATTITLIGELWSVLVSAGESYLIRDNRIGPGSPCVDAGDNLAVPAGVTTDLYGDPRFIDIPETPDTGSGDPPLVDMGINEIQREGCPADLDLDGQVGVLDFLQLLGAWGPCDGCPQDVNEDGDVGVADFLELLATWGPCP